MVMFDSLNRLWVPPYGGQAGAHVDLPSFARLAARTVSFDRCYVGSMPCMPARRELHTGRANFLHRSWGPLEPFDDSMPELLKAAGVYSHLATDHFHYWEDGGATYHNRYTTYDLVRGQQGDPWKPVVAQGPDPEALEYRRDVRWRQDVVNRRWTVDEARHPQTVTFDLGLEFLDLNHDADLWFLQVETFDPHEPFFSPGEQPPGPRFDWPDNRRVAESPDGAAIAVDAYRRLLQMCDRSLGRVLDAFDTHDLWQDTMLIVCTDHGFLLGEHGWWGKNAMPWYEELSHVPLYVWDPRSGVTAERQDAMVQFMDLAPTLLEYFDVERTERMEGRPLRELIAAGAGRPAAMFGMFAGHVNVTDGRYVYMRACADESNSPLWDYTLMPMRMASMASIRDLRALDLTDPQDWAQGLRLVRLPPMRMGNPYPMGTLLFDLETDPGQTTPLVDDAVELRLAALLVERMRENQAPTDQYLRLGLPPTGPLTREHLLARADHARAVRVDVPMPITDELEATRGDMVGIHTPVRELVEVPGARAEIEATLGVVLGDAMLARMGHLSPYRLATHAPGVGQPELTELHRRLGALVAVAG